MAGDEKLPLILTVDSFPEWHWVIRHVLKKSEFRLVYAGSVREATYLLESENFSLIISGVKMPDGSGLEVLSLAEARNIPFILCTAYLEEALPDFRYRKCAYVWKGEIKKLQAVVERLLGSAS